jgi:phytoene synthase
VNPQTAPLARKTNFYFAFLLLPRDQRLALEKLYRFCWAADEISDSPLPPEAKRKNLKEFKKAFKSCLAGRTADPFFKEFREVVTGFKLSRKALEDILRGVELDLKPVRFASFKELHRYALWVAGGPGVASMEIFGFKDQAHRFYAVNLGVFLQLVNVTRDFKEDAALHRQYLPTEDFKRFGLNPLQIKGSDPRWKNFVEFQLERAKSFLEKSRGALDSRQRKALPAAEAIASLYLKLHEKLKKHPEEILRGKISLSQREKLQAVARSLLPLNPERK